MTDDFITMFRCVHCRGNVRFEGPAVKVDGHYMEGCLACPEHGTVAEIIEGVVVAIQEISDTKQSVREFWSNHPCQGRYEDDRTQYEGVRERRYEVYPWLNAGVAEFNRHGQDTMLEIGCSQAIDMSEFLRSGVGHYVGLDLSLESIILGRARLGHFGQFTENVDLVCADSEQMPLGSNLFDYIYSYGAIHHSQDTPAIVEQIHRVLKPAGRFNVMYYYKYALTYPIEETVKLIHRLLVWITRDKDIFWKICKRLPFRPKMGPYANFLETGYSAILHAPFAHVFGRRESRRIFSNFTIESMKLYNLSPVVEPFVRKVFGVRFRDWLVALIGWDLVIKGVK